MTKNYQAECLSQVPTKSSRACHSLFTQEGIAVRLERGPVRCSHAPVGPRRRRGIVVALGGWASRPLRASSKINASMGNTRTTSATRPFCQEPVRHVATRRSRDRSAPRNSSVRKGIKSGILIKPSSKPSNSRVRIVSHCSQDFHVDDSLMRRRNVYSLGMERKANRRHTRFMAESPHFVSIPSSSVVLPAPGSPQRTRHGRSIRWGGSLTW